MDAGTSARKGIAVHLPWPIVKKRKVLMLEELPPSVSLLAPGVELMPIGEESLTLAGTLRGPRHVASFGVLLRDGQLGCYALHEGNAIGHAWSVLNASPTPLRVNRYFDIPPASAFIHFCYVAPGMRGLGVYRSMVHSLCTRALGVAGIFRVLVDTDQDNEASIRGLRGAGFALVGEVSCLQVGPVVVWRRQSMCK